MSRVIITIPKIDRDKSLLNIDGKAFCNNLRLTILGPDLSSWKI